MVTLEANVDFPSFGTRVLAKGGFGSGRQLSNEVGDVLFIADSVVVVVRLLVHVGMSST